MKCRHGLHMVQSRCDCSGEHNRGEQPPARGMGHYGTHISEVVPVSGYSACGHVSKDSPARLGAPRIGDPLSVVLGHRLRWLRVKRGLSRKQVAERLRAPVEQIESHERGTLRIEPRDLVNYARLFRVRISEFFKDPPTKGTA